ncbi:DUF4279 domain-containing protein [Streptomyces sp. H27-C3]|uniref:DUF4279 domain-containing protein n=1 Tax=Streptomyces sp. H27-C3 TaxID=3046305 RepID=UPI0024BA9FDE|nr:DUF4279 domain-containing protein [Streptomyces sp. H27-C3]MDJ0464509.1 DUF4279 domain-containing protein [Streptomyces sp. H27-C3]
MHLDQYVYFALYSKETTADAMTARLGLTPDGTSVRGSEFPEHDVPRHHRWVVECRDPDLPVDEQMERVLGRLLIYRDEIAALAAQLAKEEGEDGGAVLQVVREYRNSATEVATHGWLVSTEMLRFLVDTGADLAVDEYDFTGPEGEAGV